MGDPMTIEILETIEEKQKTISLYQEVFHDPDQFISYYYREKCKDNRIIVKKNNSDIIAMIHLNPYTIIVDGNEYPTFYIVAVATKKQYRHQGHMRDLLSAAFEWMRERDIPFCFLMPVDPKIYEPFGFEKICEFDRNAERSEEEIRQNFDVYCKRDIVYQEHFRQEKQLAELLKGEGDGLPDHPIIMAADVNHEQFAKMAGFCEKASSSDLLQWLKEKKIYICEEV
ncbi:MAG: GNAT family N-acetyltransferase [Clostridiales bacterium]|nr:GNAT family N-acetyltransferase [Clostridiales bacterium]